MPPELKKHSQEERSGQAAVKRAEKQAKVDAKERAAVEQAAADQESYIEIARLEDEMAETRQRLDEQLRTMRERGDALDAKITTPSAASDDDNEVPPSDGANAEASGDGGYESKEGDSDKPSPTQVTFTCHYMQHL